MTLEEIGPGGRDKQQRASHTLEDLLKQIEQRLLAPVQVLDHDHHRSLGRRLGHQLDPRILESIPHPQRMQVADHVEAESNAEDLVPSQKDAHALGGITFADAELLLENLRERRIGALPVRQATADTEKGGRLLSRQPLPKLADEARLADPGITDDKNQPRLTIRDHGPVGAP